MGAAKDNPLGFWEPRTAFTINETFLYRHRSSFHDPSLRLQEEGAFDAEQKAACIAEIRAFLGPLAAAPIVVIKEPRITALTGVWFEAARQAGFDIAAVIAVRHPQEVIASLAERDRASQELSGALWLKYTLLAETRTRALPRVFVDYHNLLEDWRREMKRISAALAIDLDTRGEGAIEEFLQPDLHHQRQSGPVTDPFGADWISTVYENMRAAAQDEPLDQSALDRVFKTYRTSSYSFRTAFEDAHRFNKHNRHVQPSIRKLIFEVFARAHWRNETWA